MKLVRPWFTACISCFNSQEDMMMLEKILGREAHVILLSSFIA